MFFVSGELIAGDLAYLSTCQGTCNCDSILGDGNVILNQQQIDAIIPGIYALDVDSVKYKLMNPDSGEGMTRAQTDEAEKWYKRFLILVISNQGRNIVPHKGDRSVLAHAHPRYAQIRSGLSVYVRIHASPLSVLRYA